MSPHVDFTLAASDSANIRFGISAPHELVRALVVLQEPSHHPLQWGWIRQVRAAGHPHAAIRDALELLTSVVIPRIYTPDFLTPPPTHPDDPVDQIRAIAHTPLDLVVRDLAKAQDRASGARASRIAQLQQDPAAALSLLAAASEIMWNHLLAPVWPQALHVLKADLVHRSHQLVDQGAGAVIDSLHERISWHAGTVRVQTSIWSQTLDCRGSGLLLVPSVFSWPGCHVITDEPAVPTIFYPARGVAESWPTRSAEHARGLERVLGAARAHVLLVLDAPTSTTQVARMIGVSTPTATHHLTALRDAGLVTSERSGREMVHSRTALGAALAAGQL